MCNLFSFQLEKFKFIKKVVRNLYGVCRWHLGFCNERYTPTRRGFDSFLGFYTGTQDYYKHTTGHKLSI